MLTDEKQAQALERLRLIANDIEEEVWRAAQMSSEKEAESTMIGFNAAWLKMLCLALVDLLEETP